MKEITKNDFNLKVEGTLDYLVELALEYRTNEIDKIWIQTLKKTIKDHIESLENELINFKNKSII